MSLGIKPAINAADWARVSSLFDVARELPQDQLRPWLDRLDRQDPGLSPWLREMLAAHLSARTDDWLERGPQLSPRDIEADDSGLQSGAHLGPWLLHERLGLGGMAAVWRATRANALPAREVALKLPLAHAGNARLAERFSREQAILARLEHPYIARLYEAGVAEDGTPWLAMECVQGQPIDDWCDRHKLTVRDRLALFVQVLEALQYAHARLVIHRDLKPSNIFVTESGQVRLLDFGIAKLLAADEQGQATALTQAHFRMMTPAYAAPEQVHGQALTTAVDIYALGVVLYQLLVGCSPYRLKIETPAQLEQAIANADVQRASSAVTVEAAALRGCSARKLRRALAGDIDTVLEKAMAQNPARRYASAAAFADDITHHLAGRPVLAQPDAPWYRLRKYIGRHRLQAAALGAVVLSLAAGLGLALWQASVARQERNAARDEAERGSAINFFFSDLLEEASRSEKPVSGSALVARAEALARLEFKDRPDALAAVLLSMGMLHNSQGRLPEARRVLEDAYAVVRDPAFRNDVACDLALLLEDKQRALKMLNAVADQPGTGARSRAACLVYLGDLLRATDAVGAEQRYRQALQEWQASDSRSPHDQATILGRLAYVAALQGRSSEAMRGYDQALAISGTMGREASTMGQALQHRKGRTLLIAGAPEQALRVFDDILAQRKQTQGGGSPPSDVLISRAQALLDLGRAPEAQQAAQDARDAAAATGHAVRGAQAACQMAWAAALQHAVPESTAATTAATAAAATAATPISADPLVNVTCALAQAQQLRAQARWTEVHAMLDPLLAQTLAEPQWAIDARLLRAEALLQTGQLVAAAADATAALAEARRLQDGTADTLRAGSALQLLSRIKGA